MFLAESSFIFQTCKNFVQLNVKYELYCAFPSRDYLNGQDTICFFIYNDFRSVK